MLGTLGEHTLIAHGGYLRADVVAVDERRVAGHGGASAEELLHLVGLLLHVACKGIGIGQRREAVAVRFGQKLHAASLVELLQLLHHLRGMQLKLLHASARKREGHLEGLAVVFDHLQQRVKSGHIAALGNVADGAVVLVVVVVVVVRTDVEETVALQMYYLMYLKI